MSCFKVNDMKSWCYFLLQLQDLYDSSLEDVYNR